MIRFVIVLCACGGPTREAPIENRNTSKAGCTEIIRGIVIDQDIREAALGATVVLTTNDPGDGEDVVITDELGHFTASKPRVNTQVIVYYNNKEHRQRVDGCGPLIIRVRSR